jgi:hypothetical protein
MNRLVVAAAVAQEDEAHQQHGESHGQNRSQYERDFALQLQTQIDKDHEKNEADDGDRQNTDADQGENARLSHRSITSDPCGGSGRFYAIEAPLCIPVWARL